MKHLRKLWADSVKVTLVSAVTWSSLPGDNPVLLVNPQVDRETHDMSFNHTVTETSDQQHIEFND